MPQAALALLLRGADSVRMPGLRLLTCRRRLPLLSSFWREALSAANLAALADMLKGGSEAAGWAAVAALYSCRCRKITSALVLRC